MIQLDTPHSVGLLWMSDQPDVETSTCQRTTRKAGIDNPAGLELTIPASEQPQPHALDCAVNGIGAKTLVFCSSGDIW